MMTLEATEARKAVHVACIACTGVNCAGCPYKYSCEEHFPYVERPANQYDVLPCDYVLSDDGLYFVAEV